MAAQIAGGHEANRLASAAAGSGPMSRKAEEPRPEQGFLQLRVVVGTGVGPLTYRFQMRTDRPRG